MKMLLVSPRVLGWKHPRTKFSEKSGGRGIKALCPAGAELVRRWQELGFLNKGMAQLLASRAYVRMQEWG